MGGKRLEAVVQGWAEGKPADELAAELGVSRRTIYRWVQTPEVKAQVEQLQAEIRYRFLRRLTIAAEKALRTMTELLESERTQLAAARVILDLYRSFFQDETLRTIPASPQVEEVTALIARLQEHLGTASSGHSVGSPAGSTDSGLPESSG